MIGDKICTVIESEENRWDIEELLGMCSTPDHQWSGNGVDTVVLAVGIGLK